LNVVHIDGHAVRLIVCLRRSSEWHNPLLAWETEYKVHMRLFNIIAASAPLNSFQNSTPSNGASIVFHLARRHRISIFREESEEIHR
jgi:hypothetical protein